MSVDRREGLGGGGEVPIIIAHIFLTMSLHVLTLSLDMMPMFALLRGGVRVMVWIREQREDQRHYY